MQDYLHPHKYPKNYKEVLDNIRKRIAEALKDSENFTGIDFCDVSAGGIQIRGFLKDVGYAYIQVTLEYDLSNADEAVQEFIDTWRKSDNKQSIGCFKSFIADGEKYGWD